MAMKGYSRSIWPIDKTLTTLGQCGPESNGNEGVLYTSQISRTSSVLEIPEQPFFGDVLLFYMGYSQCILSPPIGHLMKKVIDNCMLLLPCNPAIVCYLKRRWPLPSNILCSTGDSIKGNTLQTDCSVDWGCRIHWLHLCRGVRPPPNECPGYNTKQSDGEVPVMLELWGMRSTPSLPSLPGPLWPGVVAPDRALSMG